MTFASKALFSRTLAACILIFGAAAVSPPADAQNDPNILVSVTAVPAAVTLSRSGAPSHASYQFKIRNNTSRNLTLVRFRGTTTVASDVAPFINPNVSETGSVLERSCAPRAQVAAQQRSAARRSSRTT